MAVAPAEPKAPLYVFERIRGREDAHRDRQAARAQLEVLWTRLGGEPEQLRALERVDPESWQFLLRYATDGPLAIQWYENRRPELEAKQRRYNGLVLAVVVLLFGLAFLLPFQPLLVVLLESELELGESTPSTGLVDVAALLGVVASGITMVLRLSAVGVRYRQQAAVFHKASAALKEQLYRLETQWRGKPLLEPSEGGSIEGGTRLCPAFDEAIRAAVGQAQAVMADERDAYFDTLIVDVNALTDSAGSATQALASRTVLRSDVRSDHALLRREHDQQLAATRLACDTVTAKIAVLERELAEAPDDRKPDLRRMLLDQRLALQEHDQLRRQLEASQRSLRG